MKIFRIFVMILFILVAIVPSTFGVAFAGAMVYSDVLSDLQVDKKFNVNDYPINQTDYSLKVIQIAESNDNTLLFYVYQPSAGKNNVLAKKIRMSIDGGRTYHDYNLTLLCRNSVFFKYKVDNYIANYSSTVKRTYDVVQIMRLADETLGDKVVDENNNKISYIQYPVSWSFSAVYRDGKIYYGKDKLDTIEVKSKYCGQLQFSDPLEDIGLAFGSVKIGMLHFIAFDTDRKIDELLAADIEYTLVCHEYYYANYAGVDSSKNHDSDISSERKKQTLKATESDSYQNGIFAHKYNWKQIMTKADFVNNVVASSNAFFDSHLTVSGVKDLDGTKWVLSFLVTEIKHTEMSDAFNREVRDTRYYVNDETILRLNFRTNGDLFNLGVVDNYQTGDGIPDNDEKYGFNEEWWKNLWNDVQEWFLIIGALIGGVILMIFLCFVFPPVWRLIKAVFRIFFAPFRWLFGSKNRR